MSPSIKLQQTLTQKQELKMTLQMRQSIEMLLKPAFELREMILAEAEENPFLEVEDWGDEYADLMSPSSPETVSSPADSLDPAPLKISDNESDMSDILAEFDWEHVRESSANNFGETGGRKKNDLPDDFNYENIIPATESFQQYLDQQISSSGYPDDMKSIMIYMAYDLNEKGFLSESDEEVAKITGAETEDVEKARSIFKEFDPKGCGCRDLIDYLRFMFLNVMKDDIPENLALPVQKLFYDEDMLALLVKKDFNTLCERLSLNNGDMTELLQFFRSGVSPYPSFGHEKLNTEYVRPDLRVFMAEGEVIIHIEDKMLPSVVLKSEVFAERLKNAKNREDRRFMKEKYRNAEWIIKSISERNRTLYHVAASIFNYQKSFLELGENFLKPLTLKDVSDDIDRHPATVSRLTNGKYVETPHGIYELKYFFVKQVNDNLTTNKRLEQRIMDIIGKENRNNPLSDDDITNILSREGIEVARRTVAKYRSKLNIPLARERKRNYQFSTGG
jgi:RNA polymerase sigma-54 factor